MSHYYQTHKARRTTRALRAVCALGNLGHERGGSTPWIGAGSFPHLHFDFLIGIDRIFSVEDRCEKRVRGHRTASCVALHVSESTLHDLVSVALADKPQVRGNDDRGATTGPSHNTTHRTTNKTHKRAQCTPQQASQGYTPKPERGDSTTHTRFNSIVFTQPHKKLWWGCSGG